MLIQKIKKGIIEIIKNIELKKSINFFLFTRSNKDESKSRLWYLFLLSTLGAVAFYSRYIFYPFDLFSMSGLWLTDLETVVDFDSQIWFSNNIMVKGELALVNFYAKFVSVSTETALQSMGILECVITCIMIFWVIQKISFSGTIAPLIAALFYSVSYTIMPVNVNYLLQHQPMFLAVSFALPAMVIYLNPGIIHSSERNSLINFILVFLAIGLIDFFTLLILLPPFLILGLIFSPLKTKISNLTTIGAYLISLSMLFAVYKVAGLYYGDDMKLIIHSGVLSVSTYTYFSHLVVGYEQLMIYYEYISYGTIGICLFLMIFFKEKWNTALTFSIYFNVLILLSKIDSNWIDNDLIKLTLAVFIPIILGIALGQLIRISYFITKKTEIIKPVLSILLIVGVLYTAFHYQKNEYAQLKKSDTVPKDIIAGYEKISTTFFPFSYAVVNDYSTETISRNKHFFIHYDEFLTKYLKRDSVYFKHNRDKRFLINNPEYVLPKSVLVFIYKRGDDKYNRIIENQKKNKAIFENFKILKKRGRKINVFFETNLITIYEIVNEPKEGKLEDLLF